MAPHMDAILQVLRTHLFAKSNNSTEHDVELATECWGLLATLPGIGCGVLEPVRGH